MPTRRRPKQPQRSAADARPSDIHTAFAALQERVKTLQEAFTKNTQIFSEGMFMLEVQHGVLRQVIEDLREAGGQNTGRLKLVSVNEGGFLKSIDWNAYIKEYIQELRAKEELEKKEKGTEPLIASPAEDVVVFGGD